VLRLEGTVSAQWVGAVLFVWMLILMAFRLKGNHLINIFDNIDVYQSHCLFSWQNKGVNRDMN